MSYVGWLSGAFTRFRSGVCRLDLRPHSLGGILDPVVRHAQPVVVISNFSYLVWEWMHGAEQSIERLAHAQGIPCDAHPKRDIIAIAREDLKLLLKGINHWNFNCWDAPGVPLPSVLERQDTVMATIACWYPHTPALHDLDGARLFVYSHDNVYLTVEARGPALVREVFARAIEGLVASHVERATGRTDPRVEPLPDEVIDYFWTSLPAFEIRIAEVSGKPGRVQLDFDERGAGVRGLRGRSDFQPHGHLDYDLRTGDWVHRYR